MVRETECAWEKDDNERRVRTVNLRKTSMASSFYMESVCEGQSEKVLKELRKKNRGNTKYRHTKHPNMLQKKKYIEKVNKKKRKTRQMTH